jgi:hypothetical protein
MKQTIIFTSPDGKKHSVRYKVQKKEDAAITDIYVMRSFLGSSVPKQIKITIETEVVDNMK